MRVPARIGDRVEKDQVLAHFDNIEAGELSSQIDAVRAGTSAHPESNGEFPASADRARNLLEVGAVPARAEYEAAESEARALEEAVRAQQSTLAGIETRPKSLRGLLSTVTHPLTTIRVRPLLTSSSRPKPRRAM
ncbi:MAG: hypothetical protein IPJ98_11315 [Bryobacterales bacterium]|nr:hypothetical protein [Bryobacterales bacterium]